ncbi:NAD(P)-dependent dehydrogenase (short-subunit alcohol dehydrogenase family) [Robertmurraya andreesenii]|uniref:NAD(P)-dependent dehydrogenase (Short-subunit alcohol dehydrogenase family) n=1 Tax=Anoxybacillus andreesenii TaxID=1325932 RepID=A0ABT9V5V2_9BACL|nr:SDR family NAD(P)-dependent oxidoreductase [Robertmurraya andreesenii]MDQ0156324.1 NAD(P)-dependent dehydrogenase (short-subunit alcohol dehydrogenase family) [Robertmurraya andreesenii]
MEALLTFIHQLPKGLDVVVSNAGKSIRRPIKDSLDRYHDFSRTMAINYFAPVQLLLSVIPLLQKNQGQIINVSTINAMLHPFPYWAAYQSSKSAFDIWFRSAAPELNALGIATTSIYLPLVKTPMVLPTEAYRKMPAMSPSHVAKIICKSMYTKRKKYRPWWLPLGQFGSLVFGGLLEQFILSNVRKKGN